VTHPLIFALTAALLAGGSSAAEHSALDEAGGVGGSPNRVTILYDAFGKDPAMKKDWGFSALVEYGGKRVLFDTGNDAELFAGNVKAAGVDLKKLDFVVISHRHLDHTAGLSHLLSLNPGVKIYVPQEVLGGVFGTSAPGSFYRRDAALPQHMRYFDDHAPERIVLGTAWVGAKFEHIDKTQEVAPGMFLISTVSDTPGTKEMRELSLAIRTPGGIALVVGCSHPGIERIVEAAAAIDKRVRIVFGGFHLPVAKDEDIARVATALHDTFKVQKLAPGHCTGEPAFASFQKAWGPDYLYAGVGSVVALP
jgi:7,8-dihydropterin-6-yl-methyl-4-(beta-D-ribofuranosyl)aminobenzene 5'-phosphate synthase